MEDFALTRFPDHLIRKPYYNRGPSVNFISDSQGKKALPILNFVYGSLTN